MESTTKKERGKKKKKPTCDRKREESCSYCLVWLGQKNE